MAFGYNEIDLDSVDSVRLVSGQITSNSQEFDPTADLTKEQKRKKQLIEIRRGDFDKFESELEDLMKYYETYGRCNEFLSEELGVPDYIKCENCANLSESVNGEPICRATQKENEEGEYVCNIIPDINTIPNYCSRDMRFIDFPENEIGEVDENIVSIAKSRREGYDELSDEMVSWEVKSLIHGLFDPRDYEDFRKSAVYLAWKKHLDGVLEEDFYPQRADAYLRMLDSPYKSDKLPGEGGDKFENSVRDYFDDLEFPMLDRLFEIEGADASKKEMDIHTKLPWGDRAIFEIYTSRSTKRKRRQISQYSELLQLSEGIEPIQILLTNGKYTSHNLDRRLFIELLSSELENTNSVKPPGECPEKDDMDKVEYLGSADSLSYNNYKIDFEPVEESKESESRLMAKLRSLGYNPNLPVYKSGTTYGLCGPTITLSNPHLYLVLHSDREPGWFETDSGSVPNERMHENRDGGIARKQTVGPPSEWQYHLSSIFDHPAVVMEVSETEQSITTPCVFHSLLSE